MIRPRAVGFVLLTLAAVACRTTRPDPIPGPNATSAAATSAPRGGATSDAAASRTPSGPASAAQRDAWLQQFARGYFPGRSGQQFMVSREGEFLVNRDPLYAFMHGSPWPYDTHVPLLLYGPPFVKALASDGRVTPPDAVPTPAALPGTPPRATRAARPLRAALTPATTRPRVVALLVLDGTRVDYFDTYRDVMPTLSRLRAGGAWYSQAHVTSVPTLTAVGHANLGTGAEPRTHGLAVNDPRNRVTGKSQEAPHQPDPGGELAATP